MSAYLFVYGTLRTDVGHPMHRVLIASAGLAGQATYRGRLYDLGRYPAAVPDNTGRWHILGELYRMREPEPLLHALDEYEGCAPGDPEPRQYRRELQPVLTQSGESVAAWMYLYNRPLRAARQFFSGDYLRRNGQSRENSGSRNTVPASPEPAKQGCCT